MKKLKLFLTGILATCVAVTGANAACTTDAESAAASITKDGAETKYCETVKDAVTTAQAGDTVHLLRNYKFTGNTTADRIEIKALLLILANILLLLIIYQQQMVD